MQFLGKVCAAALTTTQPIFDRLFGLQELTGEKYAQMPAYEEYRELLKSPVADLNNAPAGEPGGILAALFLDQFHDDIPFLSIDSGALPFTRSASDWPASWRYRIWSAVTLLLCERICLKSFRNKYAAKRGVQIAGMFFSNTL